MDNDLVITVPGRWVAQVAALLGRRSRRRATATTPGPGAEPTSRPSTMQIIERVSAQHQEKLGTGVLHLAGDFRRLW